MKELAYATLSARKILAMTSQDFSRWIDPRTWPWFIYVWLAFGLAGWAKPFWRWLQKNRAQSWPTAEGHIESVEVTQPKGFAATFTSRQSLPYVAELGYSFSMSGMVHAGRLKREFGSEEEASEFVRELKGKPVTIHYNPNNPDVSVAADHSIESLLQTRAPVSAATSVSQQAADFIPQRLKPFLWVFIALSAVGLVVSLWVHLGAVMGRQVAPDSFFFILHAGIFVVWIPAVLVAQRRVGNVNRKDFWKAVLRGSPEWMRYMVYGFLGYAVVNFLFFMLKAPPGGSSGNPQPDSWRGFSGHWMAFYSAALAILYSAKRAEDSSLRCSNGHSIPPGANFCARCGQPVTPFR